MIQEERSNIVGAWTDEKEAIKNLTKCITSEALYNSDKYGYISHEIVEECFFIMGYEGTESKCCICMKDYNVRKCTPDNIQCN
jgi:hypothetical protein